MNERIALGFGNNIDYEVVWDSKVIENLIIQYDIHHAELDTNRVIKSERDLVISILGFLQIGSGGERFVSTSQIIEDFSQKFAKKITLGGTSVRAAVAMRKLGYTSALHLVTTNDHVRKLIPQDSSYVCSNPQDSLHPHLIIQFGKDARVTANNIDICTQYANRLIYHSDNDNIEMKLNEDFSNLITDAKVLLISGFNAMQSETLLVNRLETLQKIMGSLPKDALVYYEDAGFYEPRFSPLIYRTLAKNIDIFALNEDELQDYLHRKLDLLDQAQIQQAVVDLQKLIPVPTLVVHTKHWALAYGKNAASFSKALKAGTSLATARFCYGDDFTAKHYKEVDKLPPSNENAIFANALNKLSDIYCVPVAHVEHSSATTVGLGDTFVGGFLSALLN